MGKISVNYDELSAALAKLRLLEKDTGYSIYSTSEFINHSRGKMFQRTNDFYVKLTEIEKVLLEVIHSTNIALNNAGIEFEKSENELMELYANVLNDLMKKE